LSPRVFEVILDFVSSSTQLLRALQDLLGIVLVEGAHFTFDMRALLDSRSSLGLTDSYQLIIHFKPVGLRQEYTILLGPFLFSSGEGPS